MTYIPPALVLSALKDISLLDGDQVDSLVALVHRLGCRLERVAVHGTFLAESTLSLFCECPIVTEIAFCLKMVVA
jgi:hypothetical protein